MKEEAGELPIRRLLAVDTGGESESGQHPHQGAPLRADSPVPSSLGLLSSNPKQPRWEKLPTRAPMVTLRVQRS